jgi:hypothetical protein
MIQLQTDALSTHDRQVVHAVKDPVTVAPVEARFRSKQILRWPRRPNALICRSRGVRTYSEVEDFDGGGRRVFVGPATAAAGGDAARCTAFRWGAAEHRGVMDVAEAGRSGGDRARLADLRGAGNVTRGTALGNPFCVG